MQDATMLETDAGTTLQVVGLERLRGAAARQRFIASMEPVTALRHPNLMRAHTVSERGDTVVIVTHAVNGATLEAIVAADPDLSVASIQSILTQLAMALDHAHAAGIVHGVFTAACVLIDANGDAIVTGMGVASALANAGTPGIDDAVLAYASPEVIRGGRATASSDQYSFGVIAYELLAGHRPFVGPAAKLTQSHLNRRPEPIETPYSAIPDEWSQAVMRMLEKRPADRFASLSDAVRVIAPVDGTQDEGFRGPLGWLVQQLVPGATPFPASAPVEHTATREAPPPPPARPAPPPLARPAPPPPSASSAPAGTLLSPALVKELLDTTTRQGARFAVPLVANRARPHLRAIGAAAVMVIAVLAWYALTPSTGMSFWSALSRLDRRLPAETMPALPVYTMTPRESVFAQPARAPRAAPPVAEAPPAEEVPRDVVVEHPRVTPPPRRAVAAPRAQPAPAKSVATAARRPLEAPAKAPVVAVAPPVVVAIAPPVVAPPTASPPATTPPATTAPANTPPAAPPAAAPPVTAPSANAAPPAPVLSAADASAAARTVVNQLRSTDARALGASMVASKIDEEFVGWLRRRPVDLEVGTPGATRVVPMPDGGAQVTYVVPISWTHASGARPKRSAVLVVAVRPSSAGATLASWALAEPFVP